MTEHSILVLTLVATLVLVVLALPSAIESCCRFYETRRGRGNRAMPTEEAARTWLRKHPPTWALVLTVAIILFLVTWRTLNEGKVTGFNNEWPDAIKCDWKDQQFISQMIFYYQGINGPRAAIGSVAVYFLVGGANYRATADQTRADDQHAIRTIKTGEMYYFPHELWFNERDKYLVDVSTTPDTQLDANGKMYKAAFPIGLDCGGKTMKQIKENGNAFIFAKRL
jgi:hypothetical protein